MNKKDNKIYITVIMPALNEEANIQNAIDDTIRVFDDYGIEGEVVVVNDGSTDSTLKIVKENILKQPDKIRVVNHAAPQGIGASFWDGVDKAEGRAVCMLPADNENYPSEIMRYLGLLEHVDMVIPSVYNKNTRSRLRNAISSIYGFIINNTFSIPLAYTTGTVLYRKSLLNELDYRCSGFFFQTDILVRLLKKGYLFAEVPYRLRIRKEGKSKALTLRSFCEVTKGYFRLMRDIYFKGNKRIGVFSPDSISAKRYGELNKK